MTGVLSCVMLLDADPRGGLRLRSCGVHVRQVLFVSWSAAAEPHLRGCSGLPLMMLCGTGAPVLFFLETFLNLPDVD